MNGFTKLGIAILIISIGLGALGIYWAGTDKYWPVYSYAMLTLGMGLGLIIASYKKKQGKSDE